MNTPVLYHSAEDAIRLYRRLHERPRRSFWKRLFRRRPRPVRIGESETIYRGQE